MQEFVVFFDNGTNTIIKADKIIDSDNYINFYNILYQDNEVIHRELLAQFSKSKIAGYSKRNICEV